MELFYYSLSVNCHKVRLLLVEKRLEYSLVPIDILKGSNLDPGFLGINRHGTVPVLRDGDVLFKDSRSILEYVDQIDGLLGGDNVDRSRVVEWLDSLDQWDDVMFSYGHMDRHQALFLTKFKRRICVNRMASSPALGEAYSSKLAQYQSLEQEMQDGQSVHTADQQLNKMLDAAEKQLESGVYLTGSEYTVADACFVAVLARVEYLGLATDWIASRPQVAEYFKRMKRRASYKKAIGWYGLGVTQAFIFYPTLWGLRLRKMFKQF